MSCLPTVRLVFTSFSFPSRKMQVVQEANSGNLRVNDGEVTGKLMKQTEGQRHSIGARILVLCSSMEMKEEVSGTSGAQGP